MHWRLLLLSMALLSFGGCHWLFGDDKEEGKVKDTGKRIAVLELSKRTATEEVASDFSINLPDPVANDDWPQAGGNATHSLSNMMLGPVPEIIWTADIGEGSSKYYRLLAWPVVSNGKVFTLDARGNVTAFRVSDGSRIWRFDTTPPDQSGETMGGGLGVYEGAVYVTTGFGEVLALKAGDGSIIWRKKIGKPLRSAPTVSGDQVYAVTIDNELNALSARSGEILWHHSGITESAALMGASSPAVEGNSVVVAYSSGEIFSLRAQNGRVEWTDILAVPEKIGALPAIADIRGLPVIDKGRVFAISHSGRMAAIDKRTGESVWDVAVGGVNTPQVAGNVVFIVDNDNKLIALARDSGRIVWSKQLQRFKDPSDRDSTPVLWWGPVLAGGRLWLTNSLGHLAAFDPADGGPLADLEVGRSFYIPPIVADGIMYLLDNNGRLIALK